MERTVSVIGLGKLGAPLAACVAAKGFRVIGVDFDARKVEDINQGRAPVFEPQLEETIRACAGRLTAHHDVGAAVTASEITFIVVATPSEVNGSFSLRYVWRRARRSAPRFVPKLGVISWYSRAR